jgi:hypothetical protein
MTQVLDLGFLPPVNLLNSTETENIILETFALELFKCENCKLIQISKTLDKDIVFPVTYPYLSGMTSALIENFSEQSKVSVNQLNLIKSDLVVDIGSNDGSLLNFYKEFSRVLGVEPTNAAKIADQRGVETIQQYFDESVVDLIISEHGKAKLVTACNVFAHIPNPKYLLNNIKNLLIEDGVFISESHYFLDLVDTFQFDTIYHEHLRYYTVGFLKTFFESNKMEIFRVDRTGTHGGSIRVWASRAGKYQIQNSVNQILNLEIEKNIDSDKTLSNFAENILNWRQEFRKLVAEIKMNQKTICALGAPSRASTLISFCGFTNMDISAVGEVSNSAKIGKDMPGTKIPIVDESLIFEIKPDYILFLSWHISDTLINVLKKRNFKGKVIIPLPVPKIIEIKN